MFCNLYSTLLSRRVLINIHKKVPGLYPRSDNLKHRLRLSKSVAVAGQNRGKGKSPRRGHYTVHTCVCEEKTTKGITIEETLAHRGELLQSKDTESGADVGDVVGFIGIEGSGEPTAAAPLVLAEPVSGLVQSGILRRYTGFPKDESDHTGGVTVAGSMGVVGGTVFACVAPEGRQGPTAVSSLSGFQVSEDTFASLRSEQTVEAGGSPEQHAA